MFFLAWIHVTKQRMHSESPEGSIQTCSQCLYSLLVANRNRVLCAIVVGATSSEGSLVVYSVAAAVALAEVRYVRKYVRLAHVSVQNWKKDDDDDKVYTSLIHKLRQQLWSGLKADKARPRETWSDRPEIRPGRKITFYAACAAQATPIGCNTYYLQSGMVY